MSLPGERGDSRLRRVVQQSPATLKRLATRPVVWRSGRPNSAFGIRQVWIAASEKTGWRPRLPVGAANYAIPGSNQTFSDHQRFSAALSERQFVVR